MGIDAQLLIGNQWDLEEIVDILNHYQGIKATIKSMVDIAKSAHYFILECDNSRSINCFLNTPDPLGNHTQLSLSSNKQGIKMLEGIAKVTGGFLCANDYKGTYEQFDGLCNEADGLLYHLKYAAIHKEIADNADIAGLSASIVKWEKEINK